MGIKNQIRVFLLGIVLFSTSTASPKIIVTSIPKCGTHLLMKCIYEITGIGMIGHHKTYTILCDQDVQAESLVGHAVCTEANIRLIEKNGFKGVFILRDPRDQCISMIHYARRYPHEWPKLAHMEFSQAIQSWVLDTSSIASVPMKWLDKKVKPFMGVVDFYDRYLGWIDHPLFYTTTFEKLVGPDGGGSKEAQIQEIMNIAHHLDHPISLDRAQKIAQNLFGKKGAYANTFRSGKIGSWRDYFTKQDKEVFKKAAGQLLIKLGYEKDLNW